MTEHILTRREPRRACQSAVICIICCIIHSNRHQVTLTPLTCKVLKSYGSLLLKTYLYTIKAGKTPVLCTGKIFITDTNSVRDTTTRTWTRRVCRTHTEISLRAKWKPESEQTTNARSYGKNVNRSKAFICINFNLELNMSHNRNYAACSWVTVKSTPIYYTYIWKIYTYCKQWNRVWKYQARISVAFVERKILQAAEKIVILVLLQISH